jgi:penicillin V acylase-like amidase (Ntn superfamily)
MILAKRTLISCILLVLGSSFFLQERALACTSIVLKANDGAAVYGRTMGWGT